MNFNFNFNLKKNNEISNNNNNNKFHNNSSKLITFSTCWYILKSKFSVKQYVIWIKNLLSIAKNFNLVIYTNKESAIYLFQIVDKKKENIKIIIKPLEEFHNYKYKDYWIKNHISSNLDLHKVIDLKLNMLWNEKIFFIQDTIKNQYFTTMFYGWCDIGYFRNRALDLHTNNLKNWPNPLKLLKNPFNRTCIQYGCVENNNLKIMKISNNIKNHYKENLKSPPNIDYNDPCFAGGFFILPEILVNYYARLYDEKLIYYFINEFFIKDDQTIVADIIFQNKKLFYIYKEEDFRFDNWFMFQRMLL
jgi:hypothetical protein